MLCHAAIVDSHYAAAAISMLLRHMLSIRDCWRTCAPFDYRHADTLFSTPPLLRAVTP